MNIIVKVFCLYLIFLVLFIQLVYLSQLNWIGQHLFYIVLQAASIRRKLQIEVDQSFVSQAQAKTSVHSYMVLSLEN